MAYSTIYPGKAVLIRAGTIVKRAGVTSKRQDNSVITVRRAEPARNGKTRVFWKSNGVLASALIA